MHQVAIGMSYMEGKKIVHRSLRARNVVLLNEQHAKICGFGMSKDLGDEDEYVAEIAGAWPLKWYAPECLYFYKFDSNSDVWSYGITLWEAASYGEKPYKGMDSASILEMLNSDERLAKPDICSNSLYDLMLECWQRHKEDRPTFDQIRQRMETIF